MQSPPAFQAWAVDVGYGHVKFSDGRDTENDEIRTDSFPSQSPAARDTVFESNVMQRRDTFIVPVNGRHYEVGKAVSLAIHGNHETEVLDQDFALSDAYAARLYGALNYMLPSLRGRDLDFLALGLPLNTLRKHSKELAARFCGQHEINVRGDVLTIHNCRVFPQPLGSYVSYLSSRTGGHASSHPMALVVDPGYNTVDWFVCHGMSVNDTRSGVALRGMSAVLRAIAENIIKKTHIDAGIPEISRLLDQALTHGSDFKLYGKPSDLDQFKTAGDEVIDEAAQAVKNAIGAGADIEVILVTGGGASLYAPALRRKFPMHDVVVLPAPPYANVRGFYLLAEQLAKSAKRAAQLASQEPSHV